MDPETNISVPSSPTADADVTVAEPNYELAVILIAAGQPQDYIRVQCGFESRRQCAAFCRDDDTRARVRELTSERAARVGRKAMVSLEAIVTADTHSDLRAQVLAIRTALEVSGDLKRDHAAPVKQVRELSVAELNSLIAATKSELDARIGRYRAEGQSESVKRLTASGT